MNSIGNYIRRHSTLTGGLALVFLSFLVRWPGIFWGYHFFHAPHLPYSADEFTYVDCVDFYLRTGGFLRRDYVCGLFTQVSPLYFAMVKIFPVIPPLAILFLTRVLNVFFGAATVLLIAALARALFASRSVAFAAGISLALASLHVVHSHMATPAISAVFWTYACILCCLRIRDDEHPFRWWMLACVCAGAGIAVKFALITLVPLIYVGWKKFGFRPTAFVGFLSVLATFFVLNMCQQPHEFLPAMLHGLFPDNFGMREHVRWFNPAMYGIMMVPAVGLPVLATFSIGVLALKRRGFFNLSDEKNRWRFFCLELPLIIYGIAICFMTAVFNRHLIFLIPYVAVLSGWGAIHLFEKARSARGPVFAASLLVFLFAYQTTSVGWTEWQHLVSRFAQTEAWFAAHQKNDETVWFPSGEVRKMATARWPLSKIAGSRPEAMYIAFNEGMTISLSRSPVTPLWSWPTRTQGYYWFAMDEPEFLQRLLKGTDPAYELAVYFPMREIIPEFILFKKLFGSYYWLAGDFWVFQRTRQNR